MKPAIMINNDNKISTYYLFMLFQSFERPKQGITRKTKTREEEFIRSLSLSHKHTHIQSKTNKKQYTYKLHGSILLPRPATKFVGDSI